MKRLRIILVAALTLGILILAFVWSSSNERGFDNPAKCVDAFYQAALSKNEAELQRCIAPAFHSGTEALIRKKNDLKTFARYSVDVAGDAAVVEMDEVRKSEMHRLRIALKKSSGGWLIVSIGAPKLIETDVKYGTSLNDVPDP